MKNNNLDNAFVYKKRYIYSMNKSKFLLLFVIYFCLKDY